MSGIYFLGLVGAFAIGALCAWAVLYQHYSSEGAAERPASPGIVAMIEEEKEQIAAQVADFEAYRAYPKETQQDIRRVFTPHQRQTNIGRQILANQERDLRGM